MVILYVHCPPPPPIQPVAMRLSEYLYCGMAWNTLQADWLERGVFNIEEWQHVALIERPQLMVHDREHHLFSEHWSDSPRTSALEHHKGQQYHRVLVPISGCLCTWTSQVREITKVTFFILIRVT
jgi:hypothetical protein